jgi:hypothetical protein
MPVSPSYAREFLTPEVIRSFENALADAKRANPRALFARLDELSAVNSDEYFSDFVHLNGAGRRIVTEAFLKQFGAGSPAMIFTSFEFISFLRLVLLIRSCLRSFTAEKWFLLVASYLFYMSWSIPCGLLILGNVGDRLFRRGHIGTYRRSAKA